MIRNRDKVIIDYTNHRGERGFRKIQPDRIEYTHSDWHGPGKQWILFAVDLEKRVLREFSMREIHSWKPAA